MRTVARGTGQFGISIALIVAQEQALAAPAADLDIIARCGDMLDLGDRQVVRDRSVADRDVVGVTIATGGITVDQATASGT